MKTSLSTRFLTATALALLIVAQPSVAATGAAEGADLAGDKAECQPLPEGVTFLADFSEDSALAARVQETQNAVGGPKIVNGPCSWCNSNSSCSTVCDDDGTWSTCGDYGVCDVCREALVEIDRDLIGQKAKFLFWGYCQFKWHYQVTYRSQNSPSCQTYTYCETEKSHGWYDPSSYCCDHMAGGCFGQQC